jgi:hypothetical protein
MRIYKYYYKPYTLCLGSTMFSLVSHDFKVFYCLPTSSAVQQLALQIFYMQMFRWGSIEINVTCNSVVVDLFFQCDKLREQVSQVRDVVSKKDETSPEEIRKLTSSLQQASLKLFEMAYKKVTEILCTMLKSKVFLKLYATLTIFTKHFIIPIFQYIPILFKHTLSICICSMVSQVYEYLLSHFPEFILL